MSVTAAEVQAAADQADMEARALKMGWKPKEQFKGAEDRWVDAEVYVRRGEEFLPLVQASNRELKGQLESMQNQLLETQRINKANEMALKELTEAQREAVVVTNTRSVEELTEAIVAAREADDTRLELQLRDQRDAAQVALVASKAKPAAAVVEPPADATKTTAFKQFETDNPWFREDPVMAQAAVAQQLQMQQAGELNGLSQAERLEKVAVAIRKRFNYGGGGQQEQRTTKVEGGGRGTGTSGSGGKTYADLPAEAKAACERASRRLNIGPTHKFKTEADWRKNYTETYFSN